MKTALHTVSYAGVWPGQVVLPLERIVDKAAELGYIDEIIMPADTRPRLIGALDMLQNKREKNPPKKHGNLPL